MIKKIYKTYGKFIRFCVIGGVNTLISLLIYTILLKIGLHYIVASTLGSIGGIANGYILSSEFVFKEELDKGKDVKFVCIYLSALIINLGIITVLIEVFKMNEIIAQIIATGFNVIYNYLLNKVWTFKKSLSCNKV